MRPGDYPLTPRAMSTCLTLLMAAGRARSSATFALSEAMFRRSRPRGDRGVARGLPGLRRKLGGPHSHQGPYRIAPNVGYDRSSRRRRGQVTRPGFWGVGERRRVLVEVGPGTARPARVRGPASAERRGGTFGPCPLPAGGGRPRPWTQRAAWRLAMKGRRWASSLAVPGPDREGRLTTPGRKTHRGHRPATPANGPFR